MPLIKNDSKAAISSNISEMVHAGHPQKQAVAAALRVADEMSKRAPGGEISQTPWFERQESFNLSHKGPLLGPTMGRADKVNTSVPNNSFVVPSHVVSALGQGNSMAGHTVLGQMFPPSKVAASKPNFPKLPPAPKMGSLKPVKMPGMKDGGSRENHTPVKVALSDGEFVVEPEHVLAVGHGDYKRGHDILRKFCIHVTHKTIDDLKKMPKPVDDASDSGE